MEEWFKFQSRNDTYYSVVEAEVSSLFSQPAYTRATVIDQFDTSYKVATNTSYTSLSKRNNTYTYFNKQTEKKINYEGYIQRAYFFL
jgi:hypothetical protein